MTQNNRRPQAPRPAGRPAPAPQARRAPAGNARRPAPAPQRRSAPVRSASAGSVKGDIVKLIIGGAIAVVLAFGLQCLWPNGFPLNTNQNNSAMATQSMVSEIYSEGPLRINEIMTSNRATITLEDETSPDWIEIMNISDGAVNLEGCSLSKTADDTMRTFTFPAMQLEAGECVLVYADSRLRDTAGEALHAPFRLSSAGDTLMLFNNHGTAIDTVNITALSADNSYARMDTRSWQTCATPTPGLANTQENYAALKQPADYSAVVISEIMSSNTKTLADENGQFYDYIELKNISGGAVNLNGWYLSDDEQTLRKWRFPEVSLNAGECIIVYASKLDRRDDPAYLHTNFGLSSEGETLLLVGPDGRIMDKVTFDLLKDNVALSLKSDGSWSNDAAPSPGKANS